MPALVARKTYQFSATVGGTNTSGMLLNVKNALKAFGWLVDGSSNASAAGMDGVDRWTATGDIVTGTSGSHSWIVLRNPSTGVRICIETYGALFYNGRVVMAYSAFTGGATNARPTAVGEVVNNNTSLLPNSLIGRTIKTRVIQSSDGKSTFIVGTGNQGTGSVEVFWYLGELVDLEFTWARPNVCLVGTSGDKDDICGFTGSGRTCAIGPNGERWEVHLGTEMFNPGAGIFPAHDFVDAVNGISGDWEAMEVFAGVLEYDGSNVWSVDPGCGKLGRIPDLWMGPRVTVATGDTWMNKAFAQWDEMITPWDGINVPEVL